MKERCIWRSYAKNIMDNNINVNLWRNKHFKSCPAGARYLYLYLLTTPHRTPLGLFFLPLEYVAFDAMDGDEDLVNEALAVLESNGFVSYDNDTKTLFLERQNFFGIDMTYTEVVNEIMGQPFSPFAYPLVEMLESQGVIDPEESNELVKLLDARRKEYELDNDLCGGYANAGNPLANKELYNLAVDITKFKSCNCERRFGADKTTAEKSVAPEEFVASPAAEEPSAVEPDVSNAEESAAVEAPENLPAEEPESKKTRGRKKAPTSEYEAEFDESVWPLYPRHIGKGLALKAYVARRKANELTLAEAVEACQNYNQYCVAHNVEKNYIKHPSTFFGPAHPYEDFFTKNLEQEQNINVTAETKAHMDELNSAFEKFMAEYPKKEGIVDAKNNFMTLVEDNNYSVDEIIQAAKNYATKCSVDKTAYEYIKKASTFLDTNTRPFVDFVNLAQNISANNAVDAYSVEDDELPTFGEEPEETKADQPVEKEGMADVATVSDEDAGFADEDFSAEAFENMSPEHKAMWDKLSAITQTVLDDESSFNKPDDNDVLEDFGADDSDESTAVPSGNGFGVSSWGTGFGTATVSNEGKSVINPMEDEYPF